MSRPNDIPQDVWDAASAAHFAQSQQGDAEDSALTATARAILAERERCAKVAESVDRWKGATYLAAAIRKGGE